MDLVLGVDAGGTGSRAVLATAGAAVSRPGEPATRPSAGLRSGSGPRSGAGAGPAVLGRGSAGPGNPCVGGVAAVAQVGAAVRQALGTRSAARVAAVVVGLAGDSALGDPAIRAAFDEQWRAIGLRCRVELVGDAVTAFAGAAPPASGPPANGRQENGRQENAPQENRPQENAPQENRPRQNGPLTAGSVLIAGTGAVAAHIDGLRVTKTADGLGWLLGDDGSGVWLGIQAVRAAARRRSVLGDAVLAHTGVRSRADLPHWAGRQSPTGFAALAPVVCGTDDPVAAAILDEAAGRLLATLSEVDDGRQPVVLAGGLLTAETPIRARIRAALGDRAWTAGDPALGAARLAAHLAGS